MSHETIDIIAARAALNDNYILLLTTNSVERDAVRTVVKDAAKAVIPRQNRGVIIGRLGERLCIHLNGAAGAQGPYAIGSLTRWMMQSPTPRPQMVMVVGFAWGNPAHVQAGDVIIASTIRDVNHLRIQNGREIRRVADQISSIGSVEDYVRTLPAPQNGGRALWGELVSAEVYLSDSKARDAILEHLPHVLGGEMEAFDLVRDLNVPWLFVKAVSDDAGDDVDRTQQKPAAEAAASLILPILEMLTQEGVLEQARQDVSVQRLNEALIGHAMRISRPTGDRDAVVNAMNAAVPRIIQRLQGYGWGQDDQELLADTLAVTIAEIAQNAFLHGNASYVNCAFNETSVLASDDGYTYDPRELTGKRGGATAWNELDSTYLKTDRIAFKKRRTKHQGNSYRFEFKKIASEIRIAKNQCSVTEVSKGSGFKDTHLTFDPRCETLYYEAREVYTMSKHFSVEFELLELLKAGKSLIVACRNERQMLMFQKRLGNFGAPELRIFVKSRF